MTEGVIIAIIGAGLSILGVIAAFMYGYKETTLVRTGGICPQTKKS